ncbi:ankyrin repeat domain-containing protein SOWAHA-like [Pyrus ussuriensis x Pyrus communis]|uniref:Ankyrin repeat domain-containing protein SOWAHA-like n=1 Tax=Pyrus ussuriensis x Pyrus communis TaxID=2448454 RepID=A0A5N5I5C1_9ROSA|nr:ankyrin repeat domain-containing protein SOWAHA-like [Pyrus ussuriensis x Pyrus communis]KAB2634333.1 ankyrin repeat domain-containing protein SOWAHA-like [Pyrus ussuriensis x Pyrus communis]
MVPTLFQRLGRFWTKAILDARHPPGNLSEFRIELFTLWKLMAAVDGMTVLFRTDLLQSMHLHGLAGKHRPLSTPGCWSWLRSATPAVPPGYIFKYEFFSHMWCLK